MAALHHALTSLVLVADPQQSVPSVTPGCCLLVGLCCPGHGGPKCSQPEKLPPPYSSSTPPPTTIDACTVYADTITDYI